MAAFLTASAAFTLARKKNFAILKASKIAENFTWAEVFVNRTDAEIMACPRIVFNEAVKTAAELQKLRKLTGPLRIASWYRPGSRNHGTGAAVDFAGSEQVVYKIWNHAIDLKWKGGMGVNRPDHPPRLHLDLLENRTWWYEHGKAVNSAPGKIKLVVR